MGHLNLQMSGTINYGMCDSSKERWPTHATLAKDFMHHVWREHIGRATLASSNIRRYHQCFVCFREATLANDKRHRQGSICGGLLHRLWPMPFTQPMSIVDRRHRPWPLHINQHALVFSFQYNPWTAHNGHPRAKVGCPHRPWLAHF